ncbi:MAG: hypothetical protein ABI678_09460, partial [Kofleriaceae bacterium]
VAACSHDASPSQPPDGAPTVQADAPTSPAPTALPLGEVVVTGPTACSGGAGTCEAVTVSCPGIEAIDATVKIVEPANPTRTVTVIGPGGGTHFYETANLVDDYLARSFRVVLVQWHGDWELSSTHPSLKAAGCRPATIYQWVHDRYAAPGAAFCVHGSSGGSGAVGYALAHYGMSSIIDHALMSFGPVFSEVQYGCEPALYTGGPRYLCDELPDAPFAYNVNQNAPALNAWEGTSTCVVGDPSAEDVARWTADSIDTGGTYDYPDTGTSFYYCIPANAGAGLGTFFIDRVTAPVKETHCFTDCSGEMLTVEDMKMMVDEMDRDCVVRH